MNKIFWGFLVVIVLLTVSSVFAESSDLSLEGENFVKDVLIDNGVGDEDITLVQQVEFDDFPQRVNVKNIDKTNLALYELKSANNEKSFFAITFAEEYIPPQVSVPVSYSRSLLNFGFGGEMKESGYLETINGVGGGLDSGYVMMREGSITGISTNLEIVNGSNEQIEIIIYKNGELIGFRNTLNANLVGIKNDHDLQSVDTVTFIQGDVISVYAKTQGNIIWRDVITIVEITTEN